MSLTGKVAVIFGAGGHVGSAVARSLTSHGASVFLLGLTQSKVEHVAREINTAAKSSFDSHAGHKGRAHALQVDAMDPIAIQAAIDTVLAHQLSAGGIDIAVNAVQLEPKQGSPLLKLDMEDVIHPIDRAVRLTLNIAKAVSPTMTSQFRATAEETGQAGGGDDSGHAANGGVIITLSSTAARLSGRDRVKHCTGGFSAACAVVQQLTLGLAAELGRKGVRVVCVRPDALPETWGKEIVFGSPQAEMKDYMAQGNMMGRNPTLEQVGETVAFLAGPSAGGITGTVIDVTCGSTAA